MRHATEEGARRPARVLSTAIACLGLLSSAPMAGPFENPLIRAAYYGDAAEVERLLGQGIDVNSRDSRGMTALMWACYKGREQVVRLLLAKKADVGAKSDAGATALVAAQRGGHEGIVRLMTARNKRGVRKHDS